MVKFLLVIGTSLFWIPVLLFVLICVLALVTCVTFILLFGSTLLLFWLLKTVYRVRSGFLLARQELVRDVGQELNNVSWWRFGRMIWKRYLKRYREEEIERKLKENEKEIDYD